METKTKTVKLLLVEDNPDDVFFLRAMLKGVSGTTFEIYPFDSLTSGMERLAQGGIDIILLDLSLPDSSGLETFRKIKARARDIPIIILSGSDDETLAINAVHVGAEDYLVKGNVNSHLLTRAVLYAIERTEAKRAVLLAEQRYRGVFENSIAGIFQTSPEGAYVDVNPALIRIYGYENREDLMSSIKDIARLLYVDPNRRSEFIKLMQGGDVVHDFESQIYRKDGSVIWISENARAVRDDQGKILYYEGMVEDITARKEAEEKLRFSELRFRSIWEKSFDGMRLTDEEGIMLAVNPAFCQIVGASAESLLGRPYTAIYSETDNLKDMLETYRQRFSNKKIENQFERHAILSNGRAVDVELSNSLVEVEGGRSLLLSVFRDVTLRKQTEERERLANLELARSQSELRKKNAILEEDLKMAREIQLAILPQQYPTFPPTATEETSLLRFCNQYHPTGEVGGDFFSVQALSETKAGLFLCDVMGHGVRSALVTALVRGVVEELRSIATDPGQLLTRINSDLRAILRQSRTPMFTTAFYLIADLEKRQIHYANAGHPKPYLIHRATGAVDILKNADGKSRPALGLFADTIYPTTTCDMAAGDVVMLFTDGLYEVEDDQGEQYSQDLLLEAVRKNTSLHCPELFTAVLDEIKQFTAGQPFADDVCMVGMEVSEKF